MEHDDVLLKHKKILGSLSGLPKKMLSIHTLDNATEFLLHELCNEGCFNLHKAAYFIDNPDFDMVKGVAGFCQAEAYADWDEIWNNPDSFTTFMQDSAFNQAVRKFCIHSLHARNKPYEDAIKDIAQEIGFSEPSFSVWNIKHENKGLLLYEKNGMDADLFEEHFLDSLYLLSFCPVF